ncbi:hypothetical protein [Burkholderia ubonensis]|uniref:hypothetical protein n=1 Tax=Burkholderia ubonensis TaxID=101571 RepID=UPI002ABE6DD0|nr:hypothetical protein [Burkholderia ubonensis]
MTESAAHLRFERRPSPVLAEHRPLYKIGQILLVLHLASRGGKSSLPRLHLFNWAFKADERQSLLVKAAEAKTLDVPAWGFDPILAIAIRFAIAEGLVREISTGYEITQPGEIFIKDALKDAGIFPEERAFLSQVGKSVTEQMVDATAKGWEAS